MWLPMAWKFYRPWKGNITTVVLMDVQMPEIDGLEAARAIMDRWPDRGTKIIAITSLRHGM